MKHAKGMRLVPDDVYQRLMSGNFPPTKTNQPSANSVESAEQSGRNLYNFSDALTAPGLGDDEKWKLYQQRLHRSLVARENLERNRLPVKVEIAQKTQNGEEEESANQEKTRQPSLSSLFTKNFREKAEKVINYIEMNGDMTWDGGVVKIRGNALAGARMVDLVNYVVKSRTPIPPGWIEFAAHLAEIGFPEMLITNSAASNYFSAERDNNPASDPPPPPPVTPATARENEPSSSSAGRFKKRVNDSYRRVTTPGSNKNSKRLTQAEKKAAVAATRKSRRDLEEIAQQHQHQQQRQQREQQQQQQQGQKDLTGGGYGRKRGKRKNGKPKIKKAGKRRRPTARTAAGRIAKRGGKGGKKHGKKIDFFPRWKTSV
jgi:hypothetical protein